MTTAIRTTNQRPSRPRPPRSPGRRLRATPLDEATASGATRTLLTADGNGRELIGRGGAAGSLLVIDRDAVTGTDERLIGHLPADELPGGLRALCRIYAEAAPEQRRCRLVTERDALSLPFGEVGPIGGRSPAGVDLVETPEATFQVERLPSRMSIPELRWTRRVHAPRESKAVSLRECIAMLEDYEPLCSLTRGAVELHEPDPTVSTTTLRAELTRVMDSPIILNRGLREAVLERVQSERTSLSEIAIRCGRIKRDSRGNQSGETSWLARRIGILPEGGQSEPTVWVHSEVLGLIAREGLGVSPLEVELG